MRTRRPLWKILLCGAAVLALLFGSFFAWVHAVAGRRWAALRARVPALVAEAKARDPRRPVLRGTAVEGDAWVDYDAALKAVATLDPRIIGEAVARVPKADVEKAAQAVATFAVALDHLALGARKTRGAFAVEFERGLATKLPDLRGARTVVNLAILQARQDLGGGNAAGARDRLLDAAQFAGDLGRNTVLIGQLSSLALLGAVLDEMRGLPPDPELARALAVLDGAWPDAAQVLTNESVAASMMLADEGLVPSGLDAGASWTAWRYGFSTRILLADAAEQHLEIMTRAAAAARAPWAERQGVVRDVEIERHPNPVLRLILPVFLHGPRLSREHLAQVRLLRRFHGEAGPLDDPFGGAIRAAEAKAWSIGADGVDDGGTGAWKPAPKGDIVLDLPRK